MRSKEQAEEARDTTKVHAEETGESVAAGQPDETLCRTHPLVPAFSICMAKKRSCPYAMAFGHQYLCRHPEHARFLVPSTRKK
ncbi:hypothetical protein [Geomonas subterranea]|uniref:hypothetical protein n=1 Tax=Geomonas subterranea TaxID=2847989 RepID=UPI001CD5BADC|nr:hypothetical protein [Geomonas fuzhouensis]